MTIPIEPFYSYNFGSLGRTLDTAKQTGFFQWFHLAQTEQTSCEPGRMTRFRPSGEKFHDLCYLEVLEAGDGAMVQIELVVQRAFIEGRNGVFAQDLVKSFLSAALPEACRHVLEDFMHEIQALGRHGLTAGSLVFRGQREEWSVKTGWSRLSLTNCSSAGERVFIVQVRPNPKAPNAKRIKLDWRMRMRRMLFGLGMLSVCLCGCSPNKGTNTPEVSLKGPWKLVTQQVQNCGKDAPLQLERLAFVIQDAPLLNRAASSFDLEKADVTGTVTLGIKIDHPQTVATGILVGEIVSSPAKLANGSTASGKWLQGYILSAEEYGNWVAKNKKAGAPTDAGEVELQIDGDPAKGYSLTGDVRSSSVCGAYSNIDAAARYLTSDFGRGIPAEWSAHVRLEKQ
jgi:hypothetical protein